MRTDHRKYRVVIGYSGLHKSGNHKLYRNTMPGDNVRDAAKIGIKMAGLGEAVVLDTRYIERSNILMQVLNNDGELVSVMAYVKDEYESG